MDRFLFAEAIEDQEIFEMILEIILGHEVVLQKFPQAEKEMRAALWSRQIKLDVYGIDEQDVVYNTEVQNRNTYNLPKRSRLHNGIIDSRLLPPGAIDFNQLNDVYIIMIMPFDLFGEGKYRYTFSMHCDELPDLRLKDGATRIFLNTRGTDPEGVSTELIELLRYFENTTERTASGTSSLRIKRMQQKIHAIKCSDEIGVKYMNAWEEKILDRQEAFAEGKAEGEAAGIEKGIAATARNMKAENLPLDTIAKVTGLTMEEIEKL